FIRNRNVLMLKGELGPLMALWEDHAQRSHLLPLGKPELIWRQLLAAFALHCASRPKNQVFAWTLNFQDPLVNYFLAGDTEWDAVAGRFFDQHVARKDHNSFYQEWSRPGGEVSRSFVPFTGDDGF